VSSSLTGRVGICTGVCQRRGWTRERERIVVASLAPGVRVSEVARRHDLSPQNLFLWRRMAHAEHLASGGADRNTFIPVVSSLLTADPSQLGLPVEIAVGGVMVRAYPGVDPPFLREVSTALEV